MIGFEFFRKIYRSDAELTIFDVGSHHGDSVAEFLNLFSKAKIFAFEPNAENYLWLSERLSGSPRVQLFNVAVGQEVGRVLLHKSNYNATHSLLPFNSDEINRWADANDFHETGMEEVEQVTLDTFCVNHGITNIDILKLEIGRAHV